MTIFRQTKFEVIDRIYQETPYALSYVLPNLYFEPKARKTILFRIEKIYFVEFHFTQPYRQYVTNIVYENNARGKDYFLKKKLSGTLNQHRSIYYGPLENHTSYAQLAENDYPQNQFTRSREQFVGFFATFDQAEMALIELKHKNKDTLNAYHENVSRFREAMQTNITLESSLKTALQLKTE